MWYKLFFNIIPVFSKETKNTKKQHNNASSINVLPFAKDNLEYVKPFKISQNQYEDPRKYLKYIYKYTCILENNANNKRGEKI